MAEISFEQAVLYGFIFPNARAWIEGNVAELARDAQLITTPNTTAPAELIAYIDPIVIEILTAPRKAREIFKEVKKGNWTTPYTKWRMEEIVGKTQPYSDYANGTTSNLNVEWATRQQYLFQTSITYGDLETAVSSVAKINLASAKQKSAATIIDIDANKFYFLGVDGRDIYGILNDPNLNPSIVAHTGSSGSTQWANKTTTEIYNDVLALFEQLVSQSQGIIDQNSSLKLCLSPAMSVRLGAATDFNVSVLDMLRKYFPAMNIVTVPELSSTTAGETVMLIASEVNGSPTGVLGFGEKMMAGRLIPDLSSYSQKFIATTYGGIILQPFAISSMIGI